MNEAFSAKRLHTDSNDLQFLKDSYRLVSDESAFADCVVVWAKKLAEVEAAPTGASLDEDLIVTDYVNDVQGILGKLNNANYADPVFEAVSEVDAAAMVLTFRGVVVDANAEAKFRFNAVRGEVNRLDWLEPASKSDFETVISNAQMSDSNLHAIVRTFNNQNGYGVAEVYTLPKGDQKASHVVVRALETRWAPEVDAMLKSAFNLTKAERDVSRRLYETRDTAQISKLRNTTGQTIRTQIRTILRKTETASQVDLIRLIGLLNARVSHKRRNPQVGWQDPWQNYKILRHSDGRRVAYSWTGAENGTPALIVHGLVQGYQLGYCVEEKLKKAGICLYAIMRPGFGESDSVPGSGIIKQHADTIEWFLDELGLDGIPAIGLGNSSPLLCYLSVKRPELFSRLLLTGPVRPHTKESLQRYTPVQKVVTKMLRYAPKMSETLARVCYQYIQQKGSDWYLAHGWGDVPEVRKTLKDPEIMPLIRSACDFTLTANIKDYLKEVNIQWEMKSETIEKVECPVVHLRGEFDRSASKEETLELEINMENFTSEEVADAGFFLMYEKPELFADRIISTVTGQN